MTSTRLPYSYNKAGSQQGSVYLFSRTNEDVNSSSEDDAIPLKSVRSRNKVHDGRQRDASDTLSHHVQPSDTLPSLSIKYNCKVSELKQINRIWNANELSARDTILIPIVKHSFLLDNKDSAPTKAFKSEPSEDVDIRTISITSLSESVDTKVFLERMNSDIKTLLAATREKTRKNSLSEVKSALTIERIFPEQVTSRRTGSSGCTLAAIFCCAVFLFVCIPVTLVYWDVVVEQGFKKLGR